MNEDMRRPEFSSLRERPVPLPPVNESWAGMRKKLDQRMPVRHPRRFPGGPKGLVPVLTGTSLAVWMAVRLLSGPAPTATRVRGPVAGRVAARGAADTAGSGAVAGS